jgi:hypothetical protein
LGAQGATTSEFKSELSPQPAEVGQPAQVVVENSSDRPRALTVRFESPNDDLTFEPAELQRLHLLSGQVAAVEFRARPRKRAILGGEIVYFFTSRVQTPREAKILSGEVVARGLIPYWLVLAGLVLIPTCACLSLLAVWFARSL